MFMERETIISTDNGKCLGGNLVVKYSAKDGAAFKELECILCKYDEYHVVDRTHFSRDDGIYCRYYIDPGQWLDYDFNADIYMWQLRY